MRQPWVHSPACTGLSRNVFDVLIFCGRAHDATSTQPCVQQCKGRAHPAGQGMSAARGGWQLDMLIWTCLRLVWHGERISFVQLWVQTHGSAW